MIHNVRKMYWDYDREERWLNKMAAKGLALRARSFFKYVFEKVTKGEYVYKIELLKNPSAHPETKKYIEFLENTGIEFVAEYYNVAYFRKKSSEGEFIIYSDSESKIKHYKRQLKILLLISCPPLVNTLIFMLPMFFLGITYIYTNIIIIILYSLIFTLGIVFLVLALKIRNRIHKLKTDQIIKQQ